MPQIRVGLAFNEKRFVVSVDGGLGSGRVALVRPVVAVCLSRARRISVSDRASEVPGSLRIEHLAGLPVSLLFRTCRSERQRQHGD